MSTAEKRFTLIHVVRDVSNLPNQMLQSPEMMRSNIPWRIGYLKDDNTFVTYLICCQPRTDKVWTVVTKGASKVLLTTGTYSSYPFEFNVANDSEYSSLPTSYPFLYPIDDTIIIEIEVTIESMTGIEKPEKIRNFGVEAKEFSDVVLKIDSEKFYVSKMFLATQSTYFNTLLMGKFKEGKKKIVELKDIDPENFQVFLELLYVDKTLTDSNIENVLKLVEMYDARNAARLCEQYLMFESTHSFRTKLKIAAQYKFEDLRTHCLNNIRTRADIRAVKGKSIDNSDESLQLDPSITDDLFELSLQLRN
ncbi:hypothetical protein CAEBREN_17303 [Caenorhabditis brenneri]|uniref:BTB domain-containing protein n=1 Tax=Caenorhabditis brenneri TaxID=135651 RepID=G0NX47_CAEBE|nr:hypothetical protein CAEBREN_17303 [Caenorhabditis brenneri]